MTKLFLFFLIFYTVTLLPGVGWGDVGKYQIESTTGGLPLSAGLHPWYHALSNCFETLMPIGTVAWKANFLSAIISSLSLCVFYNILFKLEFKNSSCLFGTLLLGLSHTFWSVSVVAESYSLFCLLWIISIGQFLLYLKYGLKLYLAYALLFLGFGMGNNLIQPFAFPAMLICALMYVPSSRSFRYWRLPCFMGLIGLTPWLSMVAYAYFIDGLTLPQLRLEAMDSRYEPYLFWNNSLGRIAMGMFEMSALVIYQFFSALIFLFFLRREHKKEVLFLALLSGTLILFCSTYLRQRAPWLMLGAYIPICFLITLGFDKYRHNQSAVRWLTLPFVSIMLYIFIPTLNEADINKAMPIEAMGPRDNAISFLRPWKMGDNSAKIYLQDADDRLQRGDILVVDFTPGKVIEYGQQIEGKLKGVKIYGLSQLDDLLTRYTAGELKSPIYFGRYNSAFMAIVSHHRDLKIEPVGYLFKVSNTTK